MREEQREAIEKAKQFAAAHAEVLRELRRLAGAAGGRATTRAKRAAARRNGAKGGRPRTTPAKRQRRYSTATVSSETVEKWVRELEAARERERLYGKGPLAPLYETLGIPVGANKEQIKGAFRALAKQFHPDASGDAGTAAKFAAVRKAYGVLMKVGQ